MYFNFDPIGPENTATTKKLDFKFHLTSVGAKESLRARLF
jgi:hypothetical protein